MCTAPTHNRLIAMQHGFPATPTTRCFSSKLPRAWEIVFRARSSARPDVIPSLVAGIERTTIAGASDKRDPGDKHRDDSWSIGSRAPRGVLPQLVRGVVGGAALRLRQDRGYNMSPRMRPENTVAPEPAAAIYKLPSRGRG